MAERPLIGLGLSLANGRATNYQRVCTNRVMDTRPEYTCLSIPPAIPPSRRGSSHVSSQGKEAASVTHDTLPQVVKASALYYKTRKQIYNIYNDHRQINKHRRLKGGQIKETPPLLLLCDWQTKLG